MVGEEAVQLRLFALETSDVMILFIFVYERLFIVFYLVSIPYPRTMRERCCFLPLGVHWKGESSTNLG